MTMFFSFFFLPAAYSAEKVVFDYLIQNASIYESFTNEPTQVDVGLVGERIHSVGDLSDREAFETIDARGWVLSPGFIDAHTHSDFNAVVYPGLQNKITQGVTTEVMGNCGMSAAPIEGLYSNHVESVWAREGVTVPKPIEWQSFADYKKVLETQGMQSNAVGLVGHGNLRMAVMGVTPKKASQSEIEQMKEILAQAMEDGARGISFGLVYLPGIFSGEWELIELCREAAHYAGVCSFHMRSESSGLTEAVREVIEIGRKANAPIQISHLKVGGGRKNHPQLEEVFRLIEEARLSGQKVQADVYPYIAGFAELGVILPDELYSRSDRVQLFQDPTKRRELLDQLRAYYEQRQMKWGWIRIAATAYEAYWPYEGKSIKEIARAENIEPEKFLIQLLADTQFEISAYYFSQDQKIVNRVIAEPYVSIGSDSIADGSRRPHPRAYGTFPKVIRDQVRERKNITMGEALYKMSTLAAEHFKIPNRGHIKEGYIADLVLFDPERIRDKADYSEPKKFSEYIQWVFLGGKPVIKKGRSTQLMVGKFL